MCGIVGFFAWDRTADPQDDSVKKAADCMALRGPDAAGFHSRHGVAFAHRRLSIIDLAGGSQPLVDAETGVCLTYNGEIYNFMELRSELQQSGHAFETRCDTEVLLRAYLEWGESCLERFVGIFAFGIYDPRTEKLFLGRDRVGAKPLYYALLPDGIAFTSTVAALRAFPQVSRRVSQSAMLHYLTTIRTTLGSQTLLEDVKCVEAGCFLRADRNRKLPALHRYWEFPIVPEAEKILPPIDEAMETVRTMVERSVQEQMISDVPLGGFLSGGVDSTIIAAIATRRGDFNAYSVGYGAEGYNEWPYVQIASDHFQMRCEKLLLDPKDFLETWRLLMREKGLPLSTPNEVPIYHLAKALKREYTVALSGEGADEVFGGYVMPYFSAYDFDRSRRNPLGAGQLPSGVDRAMMRLYQQPNLSNHVDHHFLLNSWISPSYHSDLLQPEVAECFEQVEHHYRGLFDRFEGCSTLDKHMHLHARINLEGLLNRVDSSTMAASVEGRVPFTDHRLAEYLFHLPDICKMDWRDESAAMQGRVMNVGEIDQQELVESKILLRRAFEREVPPEIMMRRKVSFPVPFREWLGGSLRDFAAELLGSSELIARSFCAKSVQSLVAQADHPSAGLMLWPLVNLALWEKECL